MPEHGPTICRWVGEPYDQISIADCLNCNKRLCPIHSLLKMIEEINPDIIAHRKLGTLP